MKRVMILLMMLLAAAALRAELSVVTTYPWIADIAVRVGQGVVKVHSLAPGSWDPHLVVPKPSMIGRVRTADLVIMNGAELEIGWLPPLLRESANRRVQPGAPGLLDLSLSVKLIEVPVSVLRAGGDVHPSGNPHFHLDPHNVPLVAGAICSKFCELDPKGEGTYRKNLAVFTGFWSTKVTEWDKVMAVKKGTSVTEYHRLFRYFMKRYGIRSAAEIEPLPGIPPTSQHLKKVIDLMKGGGIKTIISDVYHPKSPAEFVAGKTGAKLVVLHHDVDAHSEARDIVALFDTMVRRLGND